MNTAISFHMTFSDNGITAIFGGRGYLSPEEVLCATGLDHCRRIEAEQVHGSGIAVVTDRSNCYEGVDALVTGDHDTALVIRTADCIPVMAYDPVHKAIGAAHAGLKGTLAGIVPDMLDCMRNHFGSAPGDMRLLIGPGIKGCCYEVGADIADRLRSVAYTADVAVEKEDDRMMLDLQLLNRYQAEGAGVRPENVTLVPLCTGCNEHLFYSYRKRKDARRMYAMIVRRANNDRTY